MEEKEHQDEQAGAAISVKKSGKSKGGAKGGAKGLSRQTKLTGTSKNSVKDTRPSAFGEPILPAVPEFCANPVKVKERKPPVEKKNGKGLSKGQTTLNVAAKAKRSLDNIAEGSEGEESELTGGEVSAEISAASLKEPETKVDCVYVCMCVQVMCTLVYLCMCSVCITYGYKWLAPNSTHISEPFLLTLYVSCR